RMMLPETAEAGDLREILPLVLGFRGKRGPGGHPLRPNGARDPNTDYLTLAMAFAAEIQKGAVLKTDVKPSEALTRALMSAESKLVYRDHKTLMINVAKEFGLERVPRSSKEWRQKIRVAMIELGKIFREIAP